MNKNRSMIFGFMLHWDVSGLEKDKLYGDLKAEGGWVEPTIGGNSKGRSLDKEFGICVKWGRSKVTGILLDVALDKDGSKTQTPNEMWKDVVSFAESHSKHNPVICAFVVENLSMFGGEGGYERVAEVKNGKVIVTNETFIETLQQHK